MKTLKILILLVLVIGMTNCGTEEPEIVQPEQEEPKVEEPNTEGSDIEATNEGITFRRYVAEDAPLATLVYYNEILGYDSLNYAFVLDDLAWQNLKDTVYQTVLYYPFPNFGIQISLNDTIIYPAVFDLGIRSDPFPPFNKTIIKFQESNIVFMHLKYPNDTVDGEDLRNDPRIIEQLKKDNKLITLEN